MPGFVCELTPACNLACAFCYNTWREPGSAQPVCLSPEKAAEVFIRTFQDADAAWATFAGGEPLLYVGLEDVVSSVKQALPHMRLGIATNGTLLTDERLDALMAAGVEHVELPLFATSQERYQGLTGVDALHDVQMAMARVKARGLPLTVASVLLADGIDVFDDVVKTAFALGADQLDLNPFTPTGHSVAAREQFTLPRDMLKEYFYRANTLAGTLGLTIAITIPIEDCMISHADYPNVHFGVCVCGKDKWVIGPDGFLRTCEQNDAVLGDLATTSFSTLASSDAVRCFREADRMPHCPECAAYKECGGGCRFRAGLL